MSGVVGEAGEGSGDGQCVHGEGDVDAEDMGGVENADGEEQQGEADVRPQHAAPVLHGVAEPLPQIDLVIGGQFTG